MKEENITKLYENIRDLDQRYKKARDFLRNIYQVEGIGADSDYRFNMLQLEDNMSYLIKGEQNGDYSAIDLEDLSRVKSTLLLGVKYLSYFIGDFAGRLYYSHEDRRAKALYMLNSTLDWCMLLIDSVTYLIEDIESLTIADKNKGNN